jgi:hypothetical protein
MGHPMRGRAGSSARARALTALVAVLVAAAVAPAGAQAVVRLTPSRLSFTATGDVRLGDLTGDGRLDLVTVSAGGFHFGAGNGAGGFPVHFDTGVNSIPDHLSAPADFDGDGHLDVAIHDQGGVSVAYGNGAGAFAIVQDPIPGAALSGANEVASGDFNGDGRADVVVSEAGAGASPGGYSVFLGQANRTFTAGQTVDFATERPTSVDVGDLNGDGARDLVFATGATVLTALGNVTAGVADGTFAAPVATAAAGRVARAADLNRDGRGDVVVLDSGAIRTLVAGPGGVLGVAASLPKPGGSATAGGIAVGDFDADTIPDVAAGDGRGPLSVAFGVGDGTLQDLTAFPAPVGVTALNGVAAGDVTGDGAADVVTGDTGGASAVWRNEPFILTSTGVLDFGAVTTGLRSAPQALLVGNDGGAPLRVSAAGVLGARFVKAGDSCTGASVRAGAVCSVAAQYAPLAAVQDGGAIQVSSNDPAGDQFAALTGRGAAPPATPAAAPAPVAATAPPAAPRAVSAAQASSATTRAVVAALRRLGLAGLAAGRALKIAVDGPAGRMTVEVRQTATDRGRAPVVAVAKGSLRLVAPARRTVTVRPTAAGRRSARRARRITAVVRTVFTPARGRVVSARSTVTLRRG